MAKGVIGNFTYWIWLAQLRSGEWPARVRAAEKLGELKERRAVSALIDALTGQTPSSGVIMALGTGSAGAENDRFPVRQAAAKALGLIGDPQAVPALVTALEHSIPAVQAEAVKALGLIGDPAGLEPLVSMLRTPYDEVRAETINALARFGAAAVKWLVMMLRREAFDARQAAAQTLGLIGGPVAVQALVEALPDPDYQVRREVIAALARLGKPAVKSLAPLLQAASVEVRAAAVQALGKIRDQAVIEPLQSCLADPESNIRGAAWHALFLMDWPPARVREQVRRAIEAGNYHHVVAAGPAAVEPLIETYRKANESTRDRLVKALVDIGPAGMDAMFGFLKDTDREVRRLAAIVLERVGWMPHSSEQRVWLALAGGRYEQAVAEGLAAIQPLAAMLRYEHEWDREMAAFSLGELRDQQVIPHLLEALAEANSRIRQVAARALGKVGGDLAARALQSALQDRDYSVRNAAREALEQLG